jgi:hypothetical protein
MAAKLKKYAVQAGVNSAEVVAYADCTESQMMAMFGWPPKLPAHDHRAGEPGEARYDRDGLDRSVR